jgi:hypothetical protein
MASAHIQGNPANQPKTDFVAESITIGNPLMDTWTRVPAPAGSPCHKGVVNMAETIPAKLWDLVSMLSNATFGES